MASRVAPRVVWRYSRWSAATRGRLRCPLTRRQTATQIPSDLGISRRAALVPRSSASIAWSRLAVCSTPLVEHQLGGALSLRATAAPRPSVEPLPASGRRRTSAGVFWHSSSSTGSNLIRSPARSSEVRNARAAQHAGGENRYAPVGALSVAGGICPVFHRMDHWSVPHQCGEESPCAIQARVAAANGGFCWRLIRL